MSRTKRRNKPHLIHSNVGTLDDARRDPWWYCRRSMRHLTPEQAYERRVARYTSDAGWAWSVPSWYTRLTCNVPERRFAKREAFRCMRNDNWDDHLIDMNYYRPYW